MKLRWIFALGLAVCAAAYVIYTIKFPTYSHRFRLTLEVEVDGKVKSGSSVIEAIGWRTWAPGRGPLFKSEAMGSAIFVDLGEGRNVISLNICGPAGKADCVPMIALQAFGLKGGPDDWRQMQNRTGSVRLADDEIPTLVTLADPSDATTSRVIEPSDLPVLFGSGVRWIGMTIEMTTDAVSVDPRAKSLEDQIRSSKPSVLEPKTFRPGWGYFVRHYTWQ